MPTTVMRHCSANSPDTGLNEETRCVQVPVAECCEKSFLFLYLSISLLCYALLFINTTFGGPPNSQNQSKQFESKQLESKQFLSKQFLSKQSLSKAFIGSWCGN
jgi:hypothetical protein